MMSLSLEKIKVRAEAWRDALGQGEIVTSESTVGGGSLPDECVATFVLELTVKSPVKFMKKLRDANPPIIARTENDKILFDPRTVLQDETLISTLKSLLSENS
jgi:L-seryl-tRNA(Ser) seleniumtransferase